MCWTPIIALFARAWGKQTRQGRARLPEQAHGGRGGREAAGVGGVRAHVRQVQPAASHAARQQLVHLVRAEQAQPGRRDDLRQGVGFGDSVWRQHSPRLGLNGHSQATQMTCTTVYGIMTMAC